MNKMFKTLSFIAAMTLFITACSAQLAQAQPEELTTPKDTTYQAVLGKSIKDKVVANFIASNNCSPANQFQSCSEAGIALWSDANQIVKLIYLYSGNTDGFRRYRGELPFGLSFYDPMWRVQEKLSDPDTADTFEQLGLPDETGSPDHMHYWAMYKHLGMTVIYNSQGNDEDAYIYAVVVSN